MDGVSQLQYVERVVDNLQKDLDKRFKNKAPQIEIDEELKKKLAGAKNRDKIDAVTYEILTNIADQMPSTWLDKWNAWRYLAMLGNPRTHIRNIVGNAIFVPAVKIKNSVAYVIESAADKVLKIGGKKGIEKSKGMVADAVKGVAEDMVVSPTVSAGSIQSSQATQADLLGNILSGIQNVVGNMQNMQTEGGNISIPVYIGGTLLDEVVVNAQQRINLRSGGR